MKQGIFRINQKSPRLRYAPAPPFNKGGFTLAEVLITLGILGIVAAITIPALVKDYQNKVYSTANMVFENRLEQALQQMNIAEDLTGHGSTAEFLNKLKKYMKIIKTCTNANLKPCFAEKVGDLNTNKLEFMGTSKWGTDVEAFILQNGTTALIKYNPGCQSPGIAAKGSELRNCIAITYDTNGLKKPNEPSKDIGGNASFLIVISDNLKMTAGDIPYTPQGTDYWAGAKKACEDLGMSLPNSGYANRANACGNCLENLANATNTTCISDGHKRPPATSDACQIASACVNGTLNTCPNGTYWLAQEYSTASKIYGYALSIAGGYVGVNGASGKNQTNFKVRCVEK